MIGDYYNMNIDSCQNLLQILIKIDFLIQKLEELFFLENFLKINLMEDVEDTSSSYKPGTKKNFTMGDLINQALEKNQ